MTADIKQSWLDKHSKNLSKVYRVYCKYTKRIDKFISIFKFYRELNIPIPEELVTKMLDKISFYYTQICKIEYFYNIKLFSPYIANIIVKHWYKDGIIEAFSIKYARSKKEFLEKIKNV